jgi:alanine racemase
MENLQTTRTWAEISLEALRHNARALRAAVGENCILLGVVKADAYGHGAPAVAKTLREEGCGYLAVACVQEALALRSAGETLPILILGAVDAAYAPLMAGKDVTLAVECAEKGRALSRAVTPGQRLKIHIKLDTGMGRLGFPAGDGDALREAAEVMSLPGLEPEGVFTHFAVSDTPGGEDYTEKQFALFTAAADELERLSGKKFKLRHCANSGGVLSFRDRGMCLDMARPGILTYGIYPDTERGGVDLIPVMTLKSRVCAVTHHKKGDTISYGRTWTAERDCTLAVLPVGYADGLQRCLSGKLTVQLRGRRVHQVGRICMDMCMVDVTDLPEVQVGDVATVFGTGEHGEPTVTELAELAGTIPYELLCGVSLRVPRIYM